MRYSPRGQTTFRCAALLLALTYCAFRVEPFESEYEESHPLVAADHASASLTLPTLNWETFDKDNAPKAIVVSLLTSFVVVSLAQDERTPRRLIPRPFRIIRDKSPPFPSATS